MLLVVVSMFVLGSIGVSAVDEHDYSYYELESLFKESLDSDGMAAEGITYELGSRFIADGSDVITRLNKWTSDDGVRKEITLRVAESLYFDNYESYENMIEELKVSEKKTENLMVVLEMIENQIETFKVRTATYQNLESNFVFPKFNPDKLERAMNKEIYASEDIYTLNLAYKTDANYFVKILSEQKEEKNH